MAGMTNRIDGAWSLEASEGLSLFSIHMTKCVENGLAVIFACILVHHALARRRSTFFGLGNCQHLTDATSITHGFQKCLND